MQNAEYNEKAFLSSAADNPAIVTASVTTHLTEHCAEATLSITFGGNASESRTTYAYDLVKFSDPSEGIDDPDASREEIRALVAAVLNWEKAALEALDEFDRVTF